MPRMGRYDKPAPETTEDTEGHMPRMGRSGPSDTVEDTEGHGRRMPAPSDTVDDDTEGHGRFAT